MTDKEKEPQSKDLCAIYTDSNKIDLQEMLPKDKYDIDYMISFCKILISYIDKMKMRPHDLSFTMSDSLKRLYSYLVIEKNQKPGKSCAVNLVCQNCGFGDSVLSHHIKEWKCKECENKKELKRLSKSFK